MISKKFASFAGVLNFVYNDNELEIPVPFKRVTSLIQREVLR